MGVISEASPQSTALLVTKNSMATFLQQAETLVRNHPTNSELMEREYVADPRRYAGDTDECVCLDGGGQGGCNGVHKVLGRKPELQHYLRVLKLVGDTRYECIVINDGMMTISAPTGEVEHFIDEENGTPGENYPFFSITFSLTTGTPATEADAEAFIKLVN
jgi:hypothetical protein